MPPERDTPLQLAAIRREIDVVIDIADRATISAELAGGNYEAGSSSWSGNPDVDENLYQFLATSGSKNNTGYSNPRLDLVLANARKATSRNSRMTLYRVAQQIVLADRPIVYLYHTIRYAGINTNVIGVHLDPDTQLRLAYAQFT